MSTDYADKNPQRPLWIGITTRSAQPAWLERWTQNYINRVHEYGGVPVVLSPDLPTHLPDGALFTPDESGRLSPEVLAQLDGLILAGGGDVHPRYFGQEPTGADPSSVDIRRDELELGVRIDFALQ